MDGPTDGESTARRLERPRLIQRFWTTTVFTLTGAREGERSRVVACFFALLALLISYYLLKPLRNSQFLKEFDADFLPVVYLGVAVFCFAITKLFNLLADRVDKYRLVGSTYLLMMLSKVGFGIALTHTGKFAVVAFYFFVSAYFALALAAMWACINDIFTPEQAQRCYGFIMVGCTLGGMLGSWFSKALSESAWANYPAQASALCMGLALGFLMFASRMRRSERAVEANTPREASSCEVANDQGEFWSDVRELLRRPYVRRIATMVFALAVFNTSILDLSSNRAIDEGVGREQFSKTFAYLPTEAYRAIRELKGQSNQEVSVVLQRLAKESGRPISRVEADYQTYRKSCETRTRGVFSDIYFYQGLLGIVLVLIVARYLFRFVGVRFAAIALPIIAAVSAIAFTFSLDLFVVELLVVVVGSTNYSLNNATKELLYSSTDEETKFKFKPMIEGPFMRFGDAVASFLALCLISLAGFLGFGEKTGQAMLFGTVFILMAFWIQAAYLAGREFDLTRDNVRTKEE